METKYIKYSIRNLVFFLEHINFLSNELENKNRNFKKMGMSQKKKNSMKKTLKNFKKQIVQNSRNFL